jgi:hypothetical protein
MVASMPLIRAVDDIGVPPVERVDGHHIQQTTADELVIDTQEARKPLHSFSLRIDSWEAAPIR